MLTSTAEPVRARAGRRRRPSGAAVVGVASRWRSRGPRRASRTTRCCSRHRAPSRGPAGTGRAVTMLRNRRRASRSFGCVVGRDERGAQPTTAGDSPVPPERRRTTGATTRFPPDAANAHGAGSAGLVIGRHRWRRRRGDDGGRRAPVPVARRFRAAPYARRCPSSESILWRSPAATTGDDRIGTKRCRGPLLHQSRIPGCPTADF